MLTLTENAQDAVRTIVAQAGDTETAGLRIAGTSASPEGYVLTIAPSPEIDDAVVESGPVRVFLPQESAADLDDKVLDAEVTPDGARFALGLQG
jgi:Fe-S cluster assembly iron-binding protein IscA